MKKMMKRVVAGALALSMTVLMAACGFLSIFFGRRGTDRKPAGGKDTAGLHR